MGRQFDTSFPVPPATPEPVEGHSYIQEAEWSEVYALPAPGNAEKPARLLTRFGDHPAFVAALSEMG